MTTYTIEIDMDALVEMTVAQEREVVAGATADYSGNTDDALTHAKDALHYANQIFETMLPEEAREEWTEKFIEATSDLEYPEPPSLNIEQIMQMLGLQEETVPADSEEN